MDWTNINLSDNYERDQNILDSYSFDSLLLDIYHNQNEINEETIKAEFEKTLRAKIDCARETFKDNLKNIVAKANEERNSYEEPGKPTPEEWENIMTAIKNSYNTPVEIETKGAYYLEYFTECLPPLIFSNRFVLCSEPYDHTNEGKGLFTGIYLKDNKYFAIITTKDNFKNLI